MRDQPAADQSFQVPGFVLAGVAVIAGAALLLEVLLTRIFAVTMWYHFGFLAISLALLGTTASAVACYAYPERLIGENHREVLRRAALLLAAILPPSVALHLAIPLPGYEQTLSFLLLLGLQVVIFSSVFFLAGLCISIALFRYAKRINKVYSLDLVGAGAGSLLVVPLLYNFSGLDVVFFVSAAACVAAWMFGSRDNSLLVDVRPLLYAILFLALGLVNSEFGFLAIKNVKSYAQDHVQEAEARKVFEKWSPVSRVAVYAPEIRDGIERMRISADAGAPTYLVRFDGDFEALEYLDRDSRQVVHDLKANGSALIIGSAGGTDVLASLRAGHDEITAVEINPVTVELVSRYYADYIGGIFQDPRVSLHMHEGRNFVAGSNRSYDVIQITMIDSWAGAAAGAYIFNENSLYTKEAIHDYWVHLAPDGFLSVTRYYGWDEALRLVNMIVEYLRSEGVTDVPQRIAVLTEDRGRYSRATVLVKRGLFTEEETRTFASAAERTNAQVIYAPGMLDVVQSDYAELFRSLIHLADEGDRQRIVQLYPRDISPSTDDRPFFFFTDRIGSALQVDRVEHAARRLALPLLYGMLVLFIAISAITMFGPLYLRRTAEMKAVPYRARGLVYFALLGVGFMLIEVSLIQRLTVFLGHPSWSFILVLTTLLWASGLGSLTSVRLRQEKRVLAAILGIIVVVVSLYVAFIYDRFIDLMWLPRAARIILATVVVALPGYFMGMCFPVGMRIVRQYHEALVPWGWAVNGAFSVLATILSVILALNVGLKASMLAGVVCYGLAMAVTLSLHDVRVRPAPATD